jgi:hypothetical protein
MRHRENHGGRQTSGEQDQIHEGLMPESRCKGKSVRFKRSYAGAKGQISHPSAISSKIMSNSAVR